ncbi:fungal pheromone STE3G-protein-coupled receptor, partial [Peniophora sp. CONT]
MGRTVDPTYPLLPVAYCLSLAMLLLVLLTGFVRQNWNLGVAFLCFWLLIETLIGAINTIVWSDNAEVKLYVYCDIVTHVQMAASIVKPVATLIITRRLFIIANLQSVGPPSKAVVDLALVGSVLTAFADYIGQNSRFEVLEGFGCTNVASVSILWLLTIQSWGVIPPLLSVTIYYRAVVRIFYQQRRSVGDFQHSDGSVSRTNYLRILAIASIDILLTLPSGIVITVLRVIFYVTQGNVPFYPGWANVHSNWPPPKSISYADQQAMGTAFLAEQYFLYWTTPILAFTIFGLFGLTAEARASYRHTVCTIGGWFGWQP